MRLDALLMEHGMITAQQASQAESVMRVEGVRFGEALVKLKVMNEHQVDVFVGEQQRTNAKGIFAAVRAVLKMLRAAKRSTEERNSSEVRP